MSNGSGEARESGTGRSPSHPKVAYEAVGEGDVIVLVAGLGGLGSFWRPVARELSRRHRVLSFDHPGVGASESIGPQSIERIVEALLRLADRLSIARFACIGHSTGGLVAQALALDAPERITALVLSCTWANPDRRFRELFELRRLVLQRAGESAYTKLGELLGYPAAWYESELASPETTQTPPGPHVAAALICERIDMLLNYQRAAELGTIAQPTLIVAAPDDQIVPISHAQDLARRIPHARLVELAGGHFVPITRSADYAAVVLEFLRNHVQA